MKFASGMFAVMALFAGSFAHAQGADAPTAEDAKALATVEQHIASYRTGNLDRFVATFAPNAEVYANGMEARGHKEIRAIFALNFAKGAPKVRVEEIEVSNGMVYVTTAYVFANGEEICCALSEYEVVDGKIAYLSASG